MTEFSWLLSLILIVPLKSMKITCQLFWSGKHLAVSVQGDTVLIVQDLFWSSWGASVRAALFSQMPVLPPRKSPARQRKLDCICFVAQMLLSNRMLLFYFLVLLLLLRLEAKAEASTWNAHRAARSWGVRSAALLLPNRPCAEWKP